MTDSPSASGNSCSFLKKVTSSRKKRKDEKDTGVVVEIKIYTHKKKKNNKKSCLL